MRHIILKNDVFYSNNLLLTTIPSAIDAKNTIIIGSKKARADIAGPGHNPTSPQPIPNVEEPMTSFLSIALFNG